MRDFTAVQWFNDILQRYIMKQNENKSCLYSGKHWYVVNTPGGFICILIIIIKYYIQRDAGLDFLPFKVLLLGCLGLESCWGRALRSQLTDLPGSLKGRVGEREHPGWTSSSPESWLGVEGMSRSCSRQQQAVFMKRKWTKGVTVGLLQANMVKAL